jgi:hypothetical protein
MEIVHHRLKPEEASPDALPTPTRVAQCRTGEGPDDATADSDGQGGHVGGEVSVPRGRGAAYNRKS